MRFIVATLVVGLWSCGAELDPEVGAEEELGTDSSEIRGGTNGAGRPWMVSVQLRSGTGWMHACGGTLIRANAVLTAAHCVPPLRQAGLSNVRVCVRVQNLTNCTADYTSAITSLNAHPRYLTAPHFDAAVLRLAKSFTTNAVIPLAQASQNPAHGQNAVVLGWGRTTVGPANGTSSLVLKELTYPIVGAAQCTQAWSSSTEIDGITSGEICAAASASRGACFGDSGGPLLFGGRQVGVMSFVNGDRCDGARPDIYTRVSSIRTWALNCATNAVQCIIP